MKENKRKEARFVTKVFNCKKKICITKVNIHSFVKKLAYLCIIWFFVNISALHYYSYKDSSMGPPSHTQPKGMELVYGRT